MAKFRIPERFKPGFELIARMTDEQVKVIKEELKDIPIGASPEEIAKLLEGSTDLKVHELRIILNFIFSLISLNIREELGREEFINDLMSSYDETNPDLSEEERRKLNNYLLNFLEADGHIKPTIKAATLLAENERIYLESRVLSDIRIIFEEKIEEPIQYAVIIHQLKITFHENSEPKEFFVALEKEELLQLKETVDRALKKDSLIRKNTHKKLSFIEVNKT